MSNISMKNVLQQSLDTFYRFPFAIIISWLGTILAIILIDDNFNSPLFLEKALLSLIVGLPLMISIGLGLEGVSLKKGVLYILKIVALAMIFLFYLFLPETMYENTYLRIILLTISFFSLISFVAYRKKNEKDRFWKFNQLLFIRVIIGVFYSMVLFAGLALAILAVENLFNFNIAGKYYGVLWVFIVGVINTLYVLSGIPAKTDLNNQVNEYPKTLKVFLQYILIPIVLTYITILYVYEIKIISIWELPKGWVSYLISSYSIMGILSFLLIYPIYRQNIFLKSYYRFFFWALLPLIVLLSMAIYVRVGDYGITENRYILIVLTLWLLFLSVYLLMNRLSNIRIIPISIFFITLFVSFGPWSVFEISQKSQMNRLLSILEKNELIQNGKYTKTDAKLNFEDQKQISSIIDYLTNNHGYKTLQPLYNENLDTLCSDSLRYQQSTKLLNLMGLKRISRYDYYDAQTKYFNIRTKKNNSYLYPIDAYDYFFRVQNTYEKKEFNIEDTDGNNYLLNYEYLSDNSTLQITINENEKLVFELKQWVNNIVKSQFDYHKNYELGNEQLILTQQLANLEFSFFVHKISGNIELVDKQKEAKVRDFEGEIFIKVSKP